MKFFLTLFVFISAFLAQVNAQECARIRRSWDVLTRRERKMYRLAVASAMQSGAYIKFVEIHTDMVSDLEAHATCMLPYWHRLFLVAYENMLRAQGPRFACVTVPYFDYVTAFARFSAGECNSIASCSQIMPGLGGVARGTPSRWLEINGVGTLGFCAKDTILSNFCESRSACASKSGARCVTRGPWGEIAIVPEASFTSIRNQIFDSNDISAFASNIEWGVHNTIHASLKGAMENIAAPADPIFWSHHASVDLFHTIFHNCKVGSEILTAEQKANHPIAWNSCSRRDGGNFNPNDQVMMRVGELGVNPTIAWNDPQLAPFFEGVPTTYASLMDIKDLGSSSYKYEVSGLMAQLAVCPDQNTNRLLMEADSATASITHNTTLSSTLRSLANFASSMVVSNDQNDKAVDLTNEWLKKTEELIKQAVPRRKDRNFMIERMQCMFQEECLGGIQDYSETFKKNFRVNKPPRCRVILNSTKRYNRIISKFGLHNVMNGYFGCPSKTMNTTKSPFTVVDEE